MCKENIIPTTVLELFIIHQMKCHRVLKCLAFLMRNMHMLSHTSSKRLQYTKASRYTVFGSKNPSVPMMYIFPSTYLERKFCFNVIMQKLLP